MLIEKYIFGYMMYILGCMIFGALVAESRKPFWGLASFTFIFFGLVIINS